MEKEKTFLSEMKAVASEFTAKEWALSIAGLVIFIMIVGLCG